MGKSEACKQKVMLGFWRKSRAYMGRTWVQMALDFNNHTEGTKIRDSDSQFLENKRMERFLQTENSKLYFPNILCEEAAR